MSELLEGFKMSNIHTSDNCPFCPANKNEEHYTTYGGSKNNSINLAKFIEAPNKFATSIESDARPKNGETGKDGRPNQTFKDNEQEKLKTILKDKGRKCKWQAHHAISGNQCLKGHDVEKFIIAGDKLKYDTGYSVNNPQNGVWLPSGFNMVKWPSDPAEKFKLAKSAMNEFQRQFHLGHHDITVDVDGLDPKTHKTYVDYVKSHLKALNIILSKWSTNCPEEDKKEKKHLGNTRIHAALDHISDHIIKKLKGQPGQWEFFISRHARDYTIKTIKPNVKLDFEK